MTATTGGTTACGGARDSGLRGALRVLEGQHPHARPAFVNRQERASLDVLTVHFECSGKDARGAV